MIKEMMECLHRAGDVVSNAAGTVLSGGKLAYVSEGRLHVSPAVTGLRRWSDTGIDMGGVAYTSHVGKFGGSIATVESILRDALGRPALRVTEPEPGLLRVEGVADPIPQHPLAGI